MSAAERVRVQVDAVVCLGVGQCELTEPEVFELDDEGIAVVVGDGRLPRERAEAIVDKCPSGAISIAEPEA